jgi:hypothetical protein
VFRSKICRERSSCRTESKAQNAVRVGHAVRRGDVAASPSCSTIRRGAHRGLKMSRLWTNVVTAPERVRQDPTVCDRICVAKDAFTARYPGRLPNAADGPAGRRDSFGSTIALLTVEASTVRSPSRRRSSRQRKANTP